MKVCCNYRGRLIYGVIYFTLRIAFFLEKFFSLDVWYDKQLNLAKFELEFAAERSSSITRFKSTKLPITIFNNPFICLAWWRENQAPPSPFLCEKFVLSRWKTKEPSVDF